MPFVMNCLDKQVSTQAHGKWFTFKPREIKMFYIPELARFMGQLRGEEGLVEIPDSIMELEKDNPERIQYLEDKRREGVNKRVQKLEWQKHNLMSSLRLDLEVKGLKVDPLILASKGDVEAIRELNTLRGEISKQALSNAELIRKELGLDGDTSGTESGSTDPRREDSTKPAQGRKQ